MARRLILPIFVFPPALAAAFLAVRVQGVTTEDRRAVRDGLLAAAFLAVRVQGMSRRRP